MESKASTARLPYEKPEIDTLSLARAGSSTVRELPGRAPLALDGVPYDRLASTYGTPLYLISEKTLRAGYAAVRRAFIAAYANTTVSYSYKTNFLSAVCAILHEEGALAEVVSGMEYQIARDLGVPGSQIIFNGPYKKDLELVAAFNDGAGVNLDSFSELQRVERLAREMGATLPVGIRVNTYLNYPPWEKFGFNLESGQAFEACSLIAASPHLKLRGFHLHAGTYITDPMVYRQGIERLIQLGLKTEAELGAVIEYLDMGGGYASENTLHSSFLRGTSTSPAIADYAVALGEPMTAYARYFHHPPRLIVEPGRVIVDPCMKLLTKVVARKKFDSGAKAVIVDAGVNVMPTAYWYKHDIQLLTTETRPQEMVDVLGGLCMNIDVLRRDARLPALREDDILIVNDVGAYNFTQSMQFIYLRPPVVMISHSQPVVVRLAESQVDLRGLERLPEHLINERTAHSKLVTGWNQ